MTKGGGYFCAAVPHRRTKPGCSISAAKSINCFAVAFFGGGFLLRERTSGGANNRTGYVQKFRIKVANEGRIKIN